MAKPLRNSLRRLRALPRDERGSFAVFASVSAVPLALCAFAAVEYAHVTSVKSGLQTALDSAALAAARSGATTPADLQTAGCAVLRANLAEVRGIFEQGACTFTTEQRTVTVDGKTDLQNFIIGAAAVTIKPLISQLILPRPIEVSSRTEVLPPGKLEVALVLDNTGSMASNGRIGSLRTAATQFVNTVFDRSMPNTVKMSLVPYVGTVNIKSSETDFPGAFSMSWMAAGGNSSAYFSMPTMVPRFHGANFSGIRVKPASGPTLELRPNTWALFDLTNTRWKGCVEARPLAGDLDVLDTPPSPSSPDTLFVPHFWPDEITYDAADTGTHGYFNSWLVSDWFRPTQLIDYYAALPSVLAPMMGPVTMDPPVLTSAQPGSKSQVQRDPWKYAQNLFGGGTEGTITETGPAASNSVIPTHGPNKSCGDPVVPLTDRRTLLTDAVGRMSPWGEGGTNTAMGLYWGWATLSSTAPFTQGAPYTDAKTRKIAVIMTDGENSFGSSTDEAKNHNKAGYSAYGYLPDQRLGTGVNTVSAATAAINSRMSLLCTNMKAQGIEIYTVLVQVPNAATRQLFETCATRPENYLLVTDVTALSSAFTYIASRVTDLHITE